MNENRLTKLLYATAVADVLSKPVKVERALYIS